MKSIRSIVVGAVLAVRAPARSRHGARTVRRDAVQRSGHRREVSHRRRPWSSGTRRSNLKVASESARPGRHARSTRPPTSGSTSKMLTELRIVLRPAKKHKFRLNYLPMNYSGAVDLHREFMFNGSASA